MNDDVVRRTKQRQTAKENHFSAMQPHQGRTPIHGGGVGVTGSCIKEAHDHYKQHQLPRPPGAPMAPRPDMPAEAEASSVSTGDGSAWVKPGCMMELARLAKIPQPESGLTCPRCQSTETKFCYYNNYSLSQPRHFCRACRRYWTHGGALRDLPFCSGIRRRRTKSASNKHNTTSSKAVACCGGASGTGRRASPSSSSSSAAVVPASSRVAAAATAILQQQPEQLPLLTPLDSLEGVEHRHHRTGASRLWFPGHSSQDHQGYHHQLGNGGIGAANSIRLEQQFYHQRQQCSLFLGYKNAVTAPSSAIGPFSTEGGADEAASFAAGQMQAISISRLPGSAALATEPAAASEYAPVEKENPTIIPSTAEMMGTLTTSSPREFLVGLQGDHDLLHFLGSGSSWASCGYGCTTAGNVCSSCTVAPGNVWAYPSSGFTSSCSASGTTTTL